MSQKQPAEDVFGKNVGNCNIAELEQWLAKHRMIENDQHLRLAEPRKVNAYLVPPQHKHSC